MTLTARIPREPKAGHPHERVAAHVRRLLRSRSLKPGDPLPSERELAGALGFSHLTVRKGLATLVREGLIERRVGRGTFVAEEDRPVSAAPLRRVALATYEHRAALPLIGYAVQGARRVLQQDAFSVEMLGVGADGCTNAFVELLGRKRIDGLIYHGHLGEDGVDRLNAAGIPFVSLGVADVQRDICRVGVDYENLFEQLVREAYRFGHRSLAWVGWAPDYSPAPHQRPAAAPYQMICRQLNLLDSVDRIVLLPSISRPDVNLVDTAELFKLQPMPTCLIVNDEIMAAGVMRDLEAHRLNVPDDVSVMALMDNTPHAHRVPLSAPDGAVEFERMYHEASGMLLRLLEDQPVEPRHRRLRCAVRFKASLAAPPARS